MRIFISALFICIAFFSISADAQKTSDKILKIDALVKSYSENHLFNGSVLVSEKGKVIFKKGYGLANMEWNIPNTTDTKFRIGSITKQFTATLVLQLKQEGKLDLHAKITEYLPWYRKNIGSKITIHHLLTHSSGIPNYTQSAEVMNDIAIHDYSPKEIAEKFCSGDLEFEPGTKFVYSNSGYFLLGVIIEEITKKSYAENLQERIFETLGMKNSGVDKASILLKKRAEGYEYGFEGFENADFINMESSVFSAGAIYSTVEDLNLWQNALSGSKILSKENQNLMLSPQFANYGYGLFIGKFKPEGMSKEITSIGHHGGIKGFSALLIRFIETDTTVILLDNTRAEKRANLENISLSVFRILNNLPAGKIKKSIQVEIIEKMRSGASGTHLASFYSQAKIERQNDYDFSGSEAFLNNFGYFLLQKGKVKDSLAVLKLAVEEFPESANTFDSYAEALKKDGQKDSAIKNYKRSLELNPQNSHAVKQLKLLESQP